jgi:hypothetical protein
VPAHIYIIYPCHILSILARVFNQTGGGAVCTFENCKKTALVVEKNTRVSNQTQKNPYGRGLLELAVCACIKKMYKV